MKINYDVQNVNLSGKNIIITDSGNVPLKIPRDCKGKFKP